jgi:hypothetical protein
VSKPVVVYVEGEEKGSTMSEGYGEAGEGDEAAGLPKGAEERRRMHCVRVGWKSPPWGE